MKKIIILTISFSLIFVGVVYAITNQPIAIESVIEFDEVDIKPVIGNVEFSTSTNEFEEIIKTGLKVPIKYNFPIATTTGYIIEEIDGVMEMNFDGYNGCRGKGKTKIVCLAELDDDIESNVQAFQENIKMELKELKQQQFQDEIILID